MAETPPEPKRRNKSVSIADAIGHALDPVLKKRGFAGRDIITHWAAIAPPPFDKTTLPDKLSWPRGASGAEGAVLVLRCAPGQALFAQHAAPEIAQAVNRYFGYLLVADVRLSAEPFSPGSGQKRHKPHQPSQSEVAKVGAVTDKVQDSDLREALRALGLALSGRSEQNDG
ncbi:DciA family protein [Devosia sp. 63-57]|uniref:DUF721 domain-containing protein n=1 Tax=Devosia sp. 63-57 TaxID=1895751 RepID=UPI00086BF8CE|nr:DciA family protein [Devosia sp. 63-57]ODT47528.1 MAG: hypothetical protein ABS74_14820 [Pelagibacterium sp. SCN 63-126]ODU86161.1 MAG: hypothetical protein ABT14_10255 [Pelagibacterium sp. SCN 63-17]OJX42764.1 MAG: hypothetical protein BGO80_15045 [Devosia sp. 63-57]